MSSNSKSKLKKDIESVLPQSEFGSQWLQSSSNRHVEEKSGGTGHFVNFENDALTHKRLSKHGDLGKTYFNSNPLSEESCEVQSSHSSNSYRSISKRVIIREPSTMDFEDETDESDLSYEEQLRIQDMELAEYDFTVPRKEEIREQGDRPDPVLLSLRAEKQNSVSLEGHLDGCGNTKEQIFLFNKNEEVDDSSNQFFQVEADKLKTTLKTFTELDRSPEKDDRSFKTGHIYRPSVSVSCNIPKIIKDNSSCHDIDDDNSDYDHKDDPVPLIRDVPIPDPEYLRAVLPPEFHPFIANKWKKDCRTWLWKSAAQRNRVLAEQNGISFISLHPIPR